MSRNHNEVNKRHGPEVNILLIYESTDQLLFKWLLFLKMRKGWSSGCVNMRFECWRGIAGNSR